MAKVQCMLDRILSGKKVLDGGVFRAVLFQVKFSDPRMEMC